MANNPVSIEILRSLFSYDPVTGIVERQQGRHDRLGLKCGGRVSIAGHGVTVTSRVAWALYHGYWPSLIIDHKDGNKLNNKLNNLREATYTQNQHNKAAYGAHGKGVTFKQDWPRSRPYQAKIRVNGKRIDLGCFATAEEAQTAYYLAAQKFQGEFAAHNSR